MNNTVEQLGRLAAKCDLDAINPDLYPAERAFIRATAERYREAQLEQLEIRKEVKCLSN